MTIVEKRGDYRHLNISYVGDGNNVANSWIEASLKLGFNLRIACPAGHEPDGKIVARAGAEAPGRVQFPPIPSRPSGRPTSSITDTWVSMGQEEGAVRQKQELFKNYQVNSALLKAAKKDVLVMHCLPAHAEKKSPMRWPTAAMPSFSTRQKTGCTCRRRYWQAFSFTPLKGETGSMEKIKKVVVAYSGGLDTSVIPRWLMETYGCEVIAFAADLGQEDDFHALEQRALKTGVSKVYVEDLKEEFVRDFIFPMLRANAVYEGSYLLGTSIARPLIAKRQIAVARREKADASATDRPARAMTRSALSSPTSRSTPG